MCVGGEGAAAAALLPASIRGAAADDAGVAGAAGDGGAAGAGAGAAANTGALRAAKARWGGSQAEDRPAGCGGVACGRVEGEASGGAGAGRAGVDGAGAGLGMPAGDGGGSSVGGWCASAASGTAAALACFCCCRLSRIVSCGQPGSRCADASGKRARATRPSRRPTHAALQRRSVHSALAGGPLRGPAPHLGLLIRLFQLRLKHVLLAVQQHGAGRARVGFAVGRLVTLGNHLRPRPRARPLATTPRVVSHKMRQRAQAQDAL